MQSFFISVQHLLKSIKNPSPFNSTISSAFREVFRFGLISPFIITTRMISSAFREVFRFGLISPFIITRRMNEKVLVEEILG